MNLKDFLKYDYFICRRLGTSLESSALEQWLTCLEAYQKSQKKERFFVGIPIELKGTPIGIDIVEWAHQYTQTSIFFYISLGVHQTISS